MTVTCSDVKKVFGNKFTCCASCHEDYEDYDIEMFSGEGYHICCACDHFLDTVGMDIDAFTVGLIKHNDCDL